MTRVMDAKKLGDFGEKVALKYLKDKGYQILGRNYFSKSVSGPKRGEVDLVAKKGNTISFVEVKTLNSKNTNSFSPEEKVDFQKQRKILKIAENWLMENKIPLDKPWQVDVISVKIDLNSKKAKISHFPNAVC